MEGKFFVIKYKILLYISYPLRRKKSVIVIKGNIYKGAMIRVVIELIR